MAKQQTSANTATQPTGTEMGGTPDPTVDPGTPPSGQNPTGTEAGASGSETTTSTGTEGNNNPLATLTPEQQAAVDAIASKARAEGKTSGQEAAKAELELKEQEEKGKFKELYEGMKPKAELADRLVTVLNDRIDTEIKDWPKEVKEADPGTDDVEVRAEWVKRNRALADRLKTAPEAPTTDAGSGLRPGATKPGATPTTKDGEKLSPGDRITTPKHTFQKKGDVVW